MRKEVLAATAMMNKRNPSSHERADELYVSAEDRTIALACPFAAKLGLELLLEIVSWLDNSSVVSLLEAMPSLKSLSILLTDHSLPLLHFNVTGVKRRLLIYGKTTHGAPLRTKFMSYNKESDKQPIKLVECTSASTFKRYMARESAHGITRRTQLLPLNKTSFLFLLNDSTSQPYETLNIHRVLAEGRFVKWIIGSASVYFPETAQNIPPSETSHGESDSSISCAMLGHYQIRTLNFDSLSVLRVENTASFLGQTLPRLEQLCVVFKTPKGYRPAISDLTAPHLRVLTVHYANEPPTITSLNLEDEERMTRLRGNAASFFERQRVFELAHTKHLQRNHDYLSSQYENSEAQGTRGIVIHDTAIFETITMTGVPDEVVYSSDLQGVRTLTLNLSSTPSFQSEPPNTPVLQSLKVTLNSEKTRFPVIFAPLLKSVSLTSTAPNTDISGLWKSVGSKLRALHIYHSRFPSFQCSKEPQEPWISSYEWQKFRNISIAITEISLDGFEMSFLEANMGSDTVVPQTFKMRPLIPSGQTEFKVHSSNFRGPVLGPEDEITSRRTTTLLVDPILQKRSKGLMLTIEADSGMTGLSHIALTAATDVKIARIGEHVLPIEDTLEAGLLFNDTMVSSLATMAHHWEIPVTKGQVLELDMSKVKYSPVRSGL